MARARVVRHGPPLELDARELAQAQADAVAEHISESIRDGVNPVDGSPQPRKADGKPLGFASGTLARQIKARISGSQERAQGTVYTPSSRAAFLEEHPELVALEGRTRDVWDEAATQYLRSKIDE